MTKIDDSVIAPVFGSLELQDQGTASFDPILRKAYGAVTNPKFASVTGLSGSPIFNMTRERLCGMTIRASLVQGICKLWYVDIFDILKLLDAIQTGSTNTIYEKMLRRLSN